MGPVDIPAQQPDPSLLRASDADRDRVAEQLRDALAEGRLTAEEHAERIEQVYSAKTYAELAPLLADLPANGASAQPTIPVRSDLPTPVQQSPTIVAIFSGAERKGRWLVEPHTNIFTMFGGVELDLREAVLSQREVTMSVTCIFGGVSIQVPPGVRVINSGVPIFGGFSQDNEEPLDSSAPTVRITGLTVFGGVSIEHKPTKAARQAVRHQRREDRRALREERRNNRHSR